MEAPAFVSAYLAYAYGASGDRAPRGGGARGPEEAIAARSRRPVQHGARVISAWAIALARSTPCEQARAEDSEWLGYLKLDKTFDSLRSEPRFQSLMKTLGFEK